MGLLAVIAMALAAWAIATGKLDKSGGRKVMSGVLGLLGARMLLTGKPVFALAFGGAAAALWPWRKSRISAPMSIEEAYALLGVDRDADEEAIRAAHRRLIAQVHPDRGGTEELARRINIARDTALRSVKRNK